ncbi:MAG: peptidoglycan editing factor PgeF [Pseudanabaenaceae cyanobacterium]
MTDWYWQAGSLRCRLLDRWQHYFLTKNQSPPPNALFAKQVHGNRCVYGLALVQQALEADGLWLDGKGARSIWVCTADCVPILVGDSQRGTVAAIHSGWRGTAAKILPLMVETLQQQGSHLEDLLFALGPAISGENYQVGQEVADRVLSTISQPVGVLPDPSPGHARLDLRLVQQQQLLELGVPPHHIAIAPYCTYANPHLFYSYRRSCHSQDSEIGKVQWSGITPWSPD